MVLACLIRPVDFHIRYFLVDYHVIRRFRRSGGTLRLNLVLLPVRRGIWRHFLEFKGLAWLLCLLFVGDHHVVLEHLDSSPKVIVLIGVLWVLIRLVVSYCCAHGTGRVDVPVDTAKIDFQILYGAGSYQIELLAHHL